MRWSSATAARFGDDGHWEEGGPDAKGGGFGCQPWARISAEVCRRAKLLGGSSTFAKGCGPGGGGGGWVPGRTEAGDDCVVFAPIDPYGRRVLIERLEGTEGR
jgi:hypothetical protein